MKCVAYARVSTEEQAEGGVSLDAQVEKMRAYCNLYDIELVDVIVDAGQSAKTLDRPGLQRALGMLDAGEADGIVVAKLDRLTRSVRDLDVLLERYFREGGSHLVSVADNVNTQTAMGRFVLNIVVSIAQWERETIVERTTDALRHKKSKGERVGSIAYGWDVGEDGKRLVPNEAEQVVIDRMKMMRRDGATFQEVADTLNELRVPKKYTGKATKRGVVGGSWSRKDVWMVLSRAEELGRCA